MATQDQVTQIERGLQSVSEYGGVDFKSGFDGWGGMDFKATLPLIDLALSITDELRPLPLDMLPKQAAKDIAKRLNEVASDLGAMKSFNKATESDADGRKYNIEQAIEKNVGLLHNLAAENIPYLAYKHIGQDEAVRRTKQTEQEAHSLFERAMEMASNAEAETQEIIQQAKTNAAGVAASEHAEHFKCEADALNTSRWWWLAASGILIAAAGCLAFWWDDIRAPLPDNPIPWDVLRHAMEKYTVLAVLFTSGVWCGREYRAVSLRHFTTKHRALSLRTFQTFAAAAVEPEVKDAVLMTATKSVFEDAQAVSLGAKDASAGALVNINLGKSAEKGAGSASGTD